MLFQMRIHWMCRKVRVCVMLMLMLLVMILLMLHDKCSINNIDMTQTRNSACSGRGVLLLLGKDVYREGDRAADCHGAECMDVLTSSC